MTHPTLLEGRSECLTQKVTTPFASVFLHMEIETGRPVSFAISAPQKLEASTVGNLLDAIGRAATEMMEAAAQSQVEVADPKTRGGAT